MAFRGTFDHTLDAKNRLTVPSKFRAALADAVVLARASSARCLEVWPEADYERHNAAALEADGPLWVALGDSMTVGIGASAYDRGWVGQLAAQTPGWRVVNLGISGGRVRDVIARQLPVLEQLAPDLVTVLIGSNDIMNPRYRTQLPAEHAELLGRLPAGAVVGNQPGGFAAALEFNRQIDDAVRDRGLVLAELRDPRTRHWSGKLAADHFHPNDRGYAGMAEIFEEALRRR